MKERQKADEKWFDYLNAKHAYIKEVTECLKNTGERKIGETHGSEEPANVNVDCVLAGMEWAKYIVDRVGYRDGEVMFHSIAMNGVEEDKWRPVIMLGSARIELLECIIWEEV